MNKSGIEWCDHTWNPITGCRHGCSYCYADKMSLRFCGNMKRNMVQTDQYRMEGDLFVMDKPFMNEDGNKDRAWYSHTNLLTAVDLLITDLDNLDESDWIRVNDEMPVERDSMFAKFKGTNKWKTGMFEKVSRNVLVTVEYDNGERHTEVAHTVDGRWKLEMRILNAKVIAWKEKPQPYKGDKNVSNM